MEILEALFAKAKYYTRIGDKVTCLCMFQFWLGIVQDGAMEAYKTLEANDKIKISTSQKIQIALNKIRIAIFHNDVELVNSNIGVAEK